MSFPLGSTKLRHRRQPVVPKHRDLGIVDASKGPGEDVRPQSRITASPMAQHYFVGPTPNENSVDGREEWLGVVAGVAYYPRGSIEAVGDEPVETHADAVAHSPHCPSNGVCPNYRLAAQPRAATRPARPSMAAAACENGALHVHGVRRRRATVPRTMLAPVQSPNAPATIATPGPAVAPRKMAVAAAQPAPAAMAPTARPRDTRVGLGQARPWYADRQRADNGRCREPEISEVIACVDGTHEPKEHRHRRKEHRHEQQQVVSLGVPHLDHGALPGYARGSAARRRGLQCQAS